MRILVHGAVFAPSPAGPARGEIDAICIEDGRILDVGNTGALLARYGTSADCLCVDAAGRLITPALIDAHTHLVFAGNRADEYARRLRGETYASIAASGGGIVSTVRATRAATNDELLELAIARAWTLHREGVRTIEVKSGYGLTAHDELRMLRVARQIADHVPVRIVTTLLATHAVPPEYVGRSDEYVSLVVDTMLPAAAAEGLADAVDVFCEGIAFSPAQCERIFARATELGLRVKAHAEQLSNQGGSALAARYGALSVDHIEYLDEAGVYALADSGTVATLLPTPFLHLRETQRPPVELLRAAGVPMAVASDYNPGSAPLLSLRLAMQLAGTLFGLRTDETLAGVTHNAARALGIDSQTGTLRAGQRAELLIWPAGMTADRLVAELDPGVVPEDVSTWAIRRQPLALWSGRVDTEDGERARRWHQHIAPMPADGHLRGATVLLGFASDAGVRRNRGRPGAAAAPAALRRALASLAIRTDVPLLDAGDVTCEGDALEAAQDAYSSRAADTLRRGARVIGLGGGHEIALASWRAVAAQTPGRVGVLNLDAHLDVRTPTPRGTSGTPFAQIAEQCRREGRAFDYLCVGASLANNTQALFERALELGAHVVLDTEVGGMTNEAIAALVRAFAAPLDALYVTLDLDVFAGHLAPGVSAPATLGLPPTAVLACIDAAISSGKLRLFDVAELNPLLDRDQQTARLAARIVSRVHETWSQAGLPQGALAEGGTP